MKTVQTIHKESISNLSFPKTDVLADPDKQKKRMADLYRSQTLGNLLHHKVKITFEDAEQHTYQVETTIWAVGNSFVSLKSGLFLPIHAILQID